MEIREIEFSYSRHIQSPVYWKLLIKSIKPNQLHRLKVKLLDDTEAYIRKENDDQKDLVSGNDVIVFLKNIKSVLDKNFKIKDK